jgi:hypothetical protein
LVSHFARDPLIHQRIAQRLKLSCYFFSKSFYYCLRISN